jgi:hypothetical protein
VTFGVYSGERKSFENAVSADQLGDAKQYTPSKSRAERLRFLYMKRRARGDQGEVSLPARCFSNRV